MPRKKSDGRLQNLSIDMYQQEMVTQLLGVKNSALIDMAEGDLSSALNSQTIWAIKRYIYRAYHPQQGGWVNGTTYRRKGTLYKNVELERTRVIRSGDKGVMFITAYSKSKPEPSIFGNTTYGAEEGGFLKLVENGPWGIWEHGFRREALVHVIEKITNRYYANKFLNDFVSSCKSRGINIRKLGNYQYK